MCPSEWYAPDTSAEAMAEVGYCCKQLKMPVVLWNKYRGNWEISEYTEDCEYKDPFYTVECREDPEVGHQVIAFCKCCGAYVRM